MIDYGLLASMLAAFGLPAMLARRWYLAGFDPPVGFIDAVLGAALAGLVAGRLTALALDDPRAVGKLSDMLVIRSGVEFWPGLATATAVIVWSARRAGASPLARLATLAPLGMVGYGAYEASCVFRDGCYGPVSPIGLQPQGLSTTMLPIWILMAVAVALGAFVVHRYAASTTAPLLPVLEAVFVVSAVRALASFWLPKVGDALTRQHRTSLIVAVAAALALGAASISNAMHSLRDPVS
jgi:prolipoprotein diacylglyceryltransferase